MFQRVANRARAGEWAAAGVPIVATALTAAGTTAADALRVTADTNVFGTVASGAGARLPAAQAGDVIVVRNGGANALLVYPDSGTINGGASASVTAAKTAIFFATTPSTWLMVLSA